MNRLLQVLLVLSVAIAVALWIAMLWLQGSTANPQTPDGDSLTFGEVADDSQVLTTADEANCERVEDEMRQLVNRSQACSVDSDCAILDYGYPIECLTSVARSQISTLRTEFRRYHESCEYRVYYDCPTGDASRRPVCREQKCVVDVSTRDDLQDETLDYLGIKQ